MDNIKVKIEGAKMILEIDLNERLYKTEKGNQMIATTHGFQTIDTAEDTYKLSLNMIKK